MTEPAVLFVCLGNICRSPMAEGAFRAAAAAAGLNIRIDSAGTAAYHVGDPPDPRAQETARKYGAEIGGLRGRQLVAEDFRRFTHVLVMDHSNLANAQAIVPDDAITQPQLLLDLVPGRAGAAVADPYYGGEEHFEDTWADVSQAAAALVEALRR
ncbi:low molecular weight protein-tyrosine-phosphatase [Novosphingobium ginsenosidimutans]|uniref:protein-tyrosine-phosphatase n=1 Tax=Novosphingobium ginsenosidimutans TaxID=1176536 RepID=A0A5B8S2U2_9SPHN|nr:low molecular weight protein-tyrosine-phosphatase [Novosphingobium ginsenosidimutans]QEA15352.1 low molecular weight phosphotyrosine protein phosphatase [Novosphingobium ginsenosidimutans]